MSGRVTILIVDDNEDGRTALRTLLELEGNDVSEATTGRQALDLVRTAAPDVIIVDLAMPDMDGLDVVRAIRQLDNGHVPFVVVYTGFAGLEASAEAAGCNAFLLKPADPGRLEALVASVSRRAAKSSAG